MSLSSVPTLLPPISFFLISIRMTILGRNVYPPPCHPAPPSHTTHHVHHRQQIKITFWISRCQAADSKVTKNYWKRSLSPISTSPFSKTNLPLSYLLKRLSRACYLPKNQNTNHCLHHHEQLNSTRIQTVEMRTHCITTGLYALDCCAFSRCECNLPCLSHWLLRRLIFQDETQSPSIRLQT